MSTGFDEATKRKLMDALTNELKVLRVKIGITQQELADRLGVSRQTYGLIENKMQNMTWSHFLALVFLFKNNEDTAKILEWTNVYTAELERYLKMHNDNESHHKSKECP